MPTTDDEEPRGRPLLKLLFWAGIGLAPIAMLLLLLADGNGPLRIAAVLAVLAVVLIGLSIGLRGDADSVRGELEDMVADEIDGLQGDVRRDIETAARATHRQLGEKLQTLQQTVDAMRAQLDGQRGGPRPPSVGVPAQARDSGSAGATYGAAPAGATPGAREGATYGRGDGGTYGSGRAGDGAYGRESHDDDRAAPAQPAMASTGRTYGAPADSQGTGGTPRPPRARAPGGVVRHTETVQVTTRHTVVDGRGGSSYRTGDVYGDDNRYGGHRSGEYGDSSAASGGGTYGGGSYGSRRAPDEAAGYDAGGYGGRRGADEAADPPAYDSRGDGYGARRGRADDEQPGAWSDGDREESFTDRRLRELRGDRPAIERGDDPAYDEHWSSARAGDRWASVRADDRGRELRVGERRASVRADDAGTEYRVEDRWAAVRRDDDRAADGPGAWYADAWSDNESRSAGTGGTYGGGGATYGSGRGYGSGGGYGNDAGDEWRDGGRRALPPAADRDSAWGRGAYDDDRGGDDRWR